MAAQCKNAYEKECTANWTLIFHFANNDGFDKMVKNWMHGDMHHSMGWMVDV